MITYINYIDKLKMKNFKITQTIEGSSIWFTYILFILDYQIK